MARDRTAPVANITSPVNGAQLTNSTVTITGTGTDSVGVSNIRLFVNGSQIASQNFTASAFVTRNLSATYVFPSSGNYTIRCDVRDKAGNVGTKSITVTYTNVTTSTTTTTTTVGPTPLLPSRKILSTPTAWNQGGEGSCGSMAASLMFSIERYYHTGATAYSQSTNEHSPEYLYNAVKINSGCGSGSTLLGNLTRLRNVGDCRWSVLPYTDQNGCDIALITPAADADAANYKSGPYKLSYGTDREVIKRLIANNHPVYFGFNMDSNFYTGGGGNCDWVWNFRGYLMAGHAAVIVGYDDSKGAYLIQNSWGPEWGCGGKIWMDYSFAEQNILGYVYAITLRSDQNFFPIL